MILLTREFVLLPSFESSWKTLKLNDNDLLTLEEILLCDPKVGCVIQGTGGLRKIRFPFENQGKSGSVRVCYVDLVIKEKIYLISAYSKNQKDNLSFKERNEIKKIIQKL